MSIWSSLFLMLLAQEMGGQDDNSLAYYAFAILLPLITLGTLFALLNKFYPERTSKSKKKVDLSRHDRWKFRHKAAMAAVEKGDVEKARKHWGRALHHGQKLGSDSQELRIAQEGLASLGPPQESTGAAQ